MSHDSDDSLLEEALRGDLPSLGTEQRVRKRLLAAGIAVGNGVAAGTAVAGGAAGGGAGVGAPLGLVGKALGASWGIKLGLAAAVAIPSLGLMLDHAPAPPSTHTVAPPRVPAEPRAATEAPRPARAEMDAPSAAPPEIAAPVVVQPRSQPSASNELAASRVEALPPAAPAERAFASVEPASHGGAASTLADETRLLDAAFAAIAARDRARAAELIRQHEDHYPSGLLKKERERAKVRLSELSRGIEGGR